MLAIGALELGLIWTSAAVYGPTALRRGASLFVALLVPAVPLLLPPDRGFWRCFAAVFALLPLFKWLQSTLDRDRAGLGERLWQWSSVFDVRRCHETPPRFDLRLAFGVALGLAAGLLGIALIRSPLGGPIGYVGGLLAVLGWVQGITEGVRFVHLLLGIEVPPIQRHPWLAKSVREFWARRWNRTVHDWLDRYMFRPLARRGHPALGVAWAFTVSAAVHFYIAWVPAGPRMAAMMASFFVAQIPLVLVERAFGASGGPSNRVFAVVALLGTSPLFIVPLDAILSSGSQP